MYIIKEGLPFVQNFIEKYFPTREMFAPLAAFLFKIAPQYETKIREFRHKNFGLFTIGMQVVILSTHHLPSLCCLFHSLALCPSRYFFLYNGLHRSLQL